jgi:hypothetical protein
MYEVAHLMIYAEINETLRHVPPQQRSFAKQIESDTPTGDLGMMVASRVILPTIADSIDPSGLRQSSNENFRAEHPGFQTESQIGRSLLP